MSDYRQTTRPRPPSGCPVCGLVWSGPGPCFNRLCSRADRSFSVVFPIGIHEGDLRRAIVRYKYRAERRWAEVFARMVAAHLARHPTWFEEFDLILGVPAYLGPGARRSWDPVGQILIALEPLVGAEWRIDRDAVIKRHETPAMPGLPWWRRQAVAAGPLRHALAVRDSTVTGARVLIFDDVMTEGSTLQEVAAKLLRAGAAEAAGLVLTRPPPPRSAGRSTLRASPGAGRVWSCRA
ncbi:MAG TPA: hypothetical protein VLX59_04850 [Acidimicrobiales bacterium]|nr:hypothetical protein [Acidimicrobiales bacterium]